MEKAQTQDAGSAGMDFPTKEGYILHLRSNTTPYEARKLRSGLSISNFHEMSVQQFFGGTRLVRSWVNGSVEPRRVTRNSFSYVAYSPSLHLFGSES